MNKLLCILSLTVTLSSCSTTSRTTWLGAGTGALTGVTAGYLLTDKNRQKKTIKSAVISSLIGATIGYFTHKGLTKRDEKLRRKTLFDLDKYNVYKPNSSTSSGKELDSSRQRIIIFTDDNNFYKSLKSSK